jgi:hypothetical protein
MDWLVVLMREENNFPLNLHDDSAMCQPSVLFEAAPQGQPLIPFHLTVNSLMLSLAAKLS